MSEKVAITLKPLGKKITVNYGTPLIDLLHNYGVEFPCGGKGTCGRCKIKLLEGTMECDRNQQIKLKQLGLDNTWRLACFCSATANVTIEVSQFEQIILADDTPFHFEPKEGFGIAVDVGTTTVVCQLLDLNNGHILDVVSDINPQATYGSDLISRIQGCLDGHQNRMQQLIHRQIGKMIESMLQKHPVTVTDVVLVGNTAMHHIFSGLNIQPLSFYPFESSNLGEQLLSVSQLQWNLPADTPVRFLPAIGSFVGSDILAGIAATKLAEKEELTLLIDLGTNGEIALGNRHKILCASTAAGPAFEGAKISQGMRAVTGAISSVSHKNGKLNCHVIGNTKARGICGSGLIDAMALLLEQELIGSFGEITSGDEKIRLTSGVCLTQQDIREFQLAKAAIAAGIQILLYQYGASTNDIKQIYIAGGFGHFLNIRNVIKTGLIEAPEEKIVKMGNTALIGAKMFLFDNQNQKDHILKITRHINLEGDPGFQDCYIDKLMLSCPDTER